MAAECIFCKESKASAPDTIWIFVGWVSPEWLSIEQDMVNRALECGHAVVLVDVTDFSYPPSSLKVSDFFWDLESPRNPNLRVVTLKPGRKLLGARTREREDWIESSVQSELLSKYKGYPFVAMSPLVKLERRALRSVARDLQEQLLQIPLSGNPVWCFPNGRYSHQRAIVETARIREVQSFCYERNRSLGRYFFRSYTVHDREALSADFETARFNLKAFESEVDDWLQERTSPNSVNNFFSQHFDPSAKSTSPDLGSKPAIVYFTSSQDELEALGKQWGMYSWSSQYESLREMAKAAAVSYQVFVRVHPNLQNKTSLEKFRELSQLWSLRRLGVSVIGPFSGANSYDLIDQAEVIATCRSTVGIEAMARGKKVIATANTYYDSLKSLKKFRSPDDLGVVSEIQGSIVDKEEARRWIAFQLWRDVPIRSGIRTPTPPPRKEWRSLRRSLSYLYYISKIFSDLHDFIPGKVADFLLRKL
jgi:hypothetical protein